MKKIKHLYDRMIHSDSHSIKIGFGIDAQQQLVRLILPRQLINVHRNARSFPMDDILHGFHTIPAFPVAHCAYSMKRLRNTLPPIVKTISHSISEDYIIAKI